MYVHFLWVLHPRPRDVLLRAVRCRAIAWQLKYVLHCISTSYTLVRSTLYFEIIQIAPNSFMKGTLRELGSVVETRQSPRVVSVR